MSVFFPYSPDVVFEYFTSKFSVDLLGLDSYQTVILTVISNAYFFLFWFVMLYFSMKLFNRIYERIF